MEKIQESTISERDFESSFDDSFVLRTRGLTPNPESGFQSANTFSFGEAENDAPRGDSGIVRLMKMDLEKKKNFFKFHIMEQKVK